MSTLILDTNILHQEGLYSRNMQLLLRLSLAEHVEIYIPELVKREYLTRSASESKEKAQEAHNNLTFIIKKLKNGSAFRSSITEIQQSFRNIEACIEEETNKEFDTWVSSYKINIIPFDVNCMSTVMDEYFLGIGVYRQAKSREDIPDAIINSNIMSLQKEKGVLTVILKDGAFKKHLLNVQDIYVFDSVKEFLSKSENERKLDELDSLFEKIESIKEYLSSDDFTTNMRASLISSKEEVEDIYLEHDVISSIEKLDVDSYGERINFPQADTINSFHISNVAWLTEGLFSLEVEFLMTATVDYCVDYSDYMYLSDDTEREIYMDSMNGDGVCDISEPRDLKFTGYIQLYINDDLDLEEIKNQSRNIGAEGSPLQYGIEVEYADIL